LLVQTIKGIVLPYIKQYFGDYEMNIIDNSSLSESLPYLAFYDNKAVAPSATVKIWKPTKKVADYRELNID
jgi:hypothetical protein